MSALEDITVIDTPRAADALDALGRLGDRDLVVIASPLSDRLPARTVTVDAGPDLKRLVAGGDPAGEDPLAGALGAIARDPAWRAIVLGPDACPPARDPAGRLLVISALGPSARGPRRSLPAARLALDVGLDAFSGLEAALVAALSHPATCDDLGAVVFLGLRPDPGTAHRLLGATAGIPLLVWDPSPRHVDAWRRLGIPATTSLDALRRAAELLVGPAAGATPPALVATSPALAALVGEAMGLAPATLPETVVRHLESELPAGTVATSPLIVPELPAAPGLPPRHHRHVAVALDALGAEGLEIVLAVASDDAFAQAAAAHPLATAGRLTLVTAESLAALAESRTLAAEARVAAGALPPAPPTSPLDDRLQALVLAATLQRATAVGGATALALARAMTSLPAAPRSVVTTPGHAEAIAKRGHGPHVIGVDASIGGLARHGPAAARVANGEAARENGGEAAPPRPVRCETPGEVFEAFAEVAPPPPSPLAYAPRFLTPIPDDATLVEVEVRAAPIAPDIAIGRVLRPSGGLPPAPGRSSLPPSLRRLAAAIADTLAADEVFAGVRVLLLCDRDGEPSAVVDAALELAPERAR